MNDVINAVKEMAKVLYSNKYMKKEEFDLISSQDNEWLSFWAIKGILSGLSIREMEELLKPDNEADDLFRLYTVSMAEEYRKYDGLIQDIEAATDEVSSALSEYEELKETVLKDLKESIESERDAWHKQLDGKNEFIGMMQSEHDRILEEKNEAEEKIKKLKEKEEKQDSEILELKKENTDLMKELETMQQQKELMQELSEKKPDGSSHRALLFRGLCSKKQNQALEQFVSKILTDKNCDKDHKEFYLDCLENGYSVHEIERILYHPAAPVDLLIRIRDFYTKEVRG